METLLLLAAVGAVVAVAWALELWFRSPLPPPLLGPATCGCCADRLPHFDRLAQQQSCRPCRAQQREVARRNLQAEWSALVQAAQRRGLTGAELRAAVGTELWLLDRLRQEEHRHAA